MEFFDLRAVMGWEDGDNTFLYPREMEDFIVHMLSFPCGLNRFTHNQIFLAEFTHK